MTAEWLKKVKSDFESKLDQVPVTRPDPSSWPKHVRMVSMDEMDHLGVDSKGRLYWDGKIVEIKQTFELKTFERSVAVFVATVALAGLLLSGWQWSCEFRPGGNSWCPTGTMLESE